MREANEDIIYRVYVALGLSEKEAEDEIENMADSLVDEVSERLQELFQDLAYENDFVRREDCVEIASGMMTEREVDY